MPSISSSLDATIAHLDALQQPNRDRQRADFEALRAIAGRLGDSWGTDDETVASREGRERTPGIGPDHRPEPDPESFVPLPRTTTKPWGASMRAKFIAEARDRGEW